MNPDKNISRRTFISSAAATAATFTIVPAHVLGGTDRVAPSDKITVANIGCGTQGLREMGGMLGDDNIQVVAVCDPNKFSTNYIDWSPNGLVIGIRNVLGDKNWGSSFGEGIPGGRDVAKDYIEKYYANKSPSGNYKGCASYEDFRELLAKEKDIDAIKIMTPDHLHATIAMAGMKAKKHIITHKPIANRMAEARLTIDMARKYQGKLITHLLAWSRIPEYDIIRAWIEDGAIGTLREIHNWSFRPVWPQWDALPSESAPIPKGFNWGLWLGPVPHRDYHPNYTHNVFRGWYDFGGGSVADMGHYSLFPLFQTLGIDKPPIEAKAFGTTTRQVINQVSRSVNNKVAFPYSCTIKLKFPEQQSLPAFDLYWYDGGMKPFAPEELEEDGRDTPNEGLMFVGDKGKILAGFQGANPEIIPKRKMQAYAGNKEYEKAQRVRRSDTWSKAILEKKESPGSFIHAQCVTEAINLAAIALRSGKKVKYDSENMKITNDDEANAYLTREYRKGWELG